VCSCKHNSDKVSEEEEEGKEEKDEKVMSSSFSLSLSLLSFASEKKSDQSSTSTRHNRRAGGNFSPLPEANDAPFSLRSALVGSEPHR
jgi:hypothetical protein